MTKIITKKETQKNFKIKIKSKLESKNNSQKILTIRYNLHKTFEYNKAKGPFEKVKDVNSEIQKILGDYGIETDFFGYKTKLPIGVAAGPLYNPRYMEGAMNDGFSVVTWKTFRSVPRLAHRNDGNYLGHNIVYLPNQEILTGDVSQKEILASLEHLQELEKISITNSFGMPSSQPNIWMQEIGPIEKIAQKKNKLVIASVVGTPRDSWDIYDLATDYAFTAKCAEMSGAKIIELNFSCPNVHGKEGQIYKDNQNAALIAKTVRNLLLPETKILLKVGFANIENYQEFILQTADYIDGIVAINTIPMKVVDANQKQALPGGLTSGTCGHIIIEKSVEAVRNLVQARKILAKQNKKYKNLKIIGCGGVTSVENFLKHIQAGAEFVMCATAALFHPELPLKIAKHLRENKIQKKI